jgi:polar amino acid transport system substrate-binding protein
MAMRVSSVFLGVAMLLAVTSCSADPSSPRASLTRASVPADLRASGTLTIGSDMIFPPMESVENGKPVGFDVDLANAIGARLGLRVKLVQTDFGELIDQVSAHDIDLAMSSMTDKASRQEQVDFVDYLNVGSSIVVRDGVRKIDGLAGLCGHRVAAQKDTMYVAFLGDQAKRCPGKAALRVVIVDNPTEAVLKGKADAYLEDYTMAVANVAKYSQIAIAGEQVEAAPYGIAVAKDRHQLTKAVQGALYELFFDGTYDKLLKKWQMLEGSLKTGAINGGA